MSERPRRMKRRTRRVFRGKFDENTRATLAEILGSVSYTRYVPEDLSLPIGKSRDAWRASRVAVALQTARRS